MDGNVLGQHKGIHFYNKGQRRGLDLNNGPWYVVDLDIENNKVIVGRKEDLQISRFVIKDMVWNYPEQEKYSGTVQTRYHSPEIACQVKKISDNEMEIVLDKPSDDVAPGQSAVIYDGEYVMGGGIISK